VDVLCLRRPHLESHHKPLNSSVPTVLATSRASTLAGGIRDSRVRRLTCSKDGPVGHPYLVTLSQTPRPQGVWVRRQAFERAPVLILELICQEQALTPQINLTKEEAAFFF
jgi:hypothetical protein